MAKENAVHRRLRVGPQSSYKCSNAPQASFHCQSQALPLIGIRSIRQFATGYSRSMRARRFWVSVWARLHCDLSGCRNRAEVNISLRVLNRAVDALRFGEFLVFDVDANLTRADIKYYISCLIVRNDRQPA